MPQPSGRGARVIVTATVLTCLAVVVLAAEQAGNTGFRVENENLDLGRVVAGSTVTATFVFHNDTARDVRIIRAAPS
jgi:hypothetical protein